MAINLKKLLEGVVRVSASDLHLKVGEPPMIRLHGQLHPIDHPELTAEDTEAANEIMIPKKCRELLERDGTVDYSYGLTMTQRFRVNCYHQRGVKSLAIRRLMSEEMTLEDLNMPPQLAKFADLRRGLVLVTGITGSGKSSTLSAILNMINKDRREHIITIEDPIECVYKDHRSMIDQIEVGHDVSSFQCALRHALRQDPDIILLGEIRDRETMQTSMYCVETGHLVFSTLHTRDAKQTITRMVHLFPKEEEEAVFLQIADDLEGVVCQRLLPTVDGKNRVPCCEVLFNNSVVKKLIREQRVLDIQQVMMTGQDGMHTFDMHMVNLVKSDQVKLEDALQIVEDEAAFKRLLHGRSAGGDRGGLLG